MKSNETFSDAKMLINDALSKSNIHQGIPEALGPKFVTPIVKHTRGGLVFPETYTEMYRWIDEMEEGLK